MTDRTPHAGDWVLVWAQIDDPNPHPDDFFVQFHSHNESWSGIVRRDRVEFPDRMPADAAICSALVPYLPAPGTFIRCVRHHRHAGGHRDALDNTYPDDAVVGYFEDA